VIVCFHARGPGGFGALSVFKIEVPDMRFFNTDVWLRRLRGLMLVLVFISVFLYIFSLNFRTPSKMDILQRSVTETVSPPIKLFGRIFAGIEDLFYQYIWLKNLRGENESLKREIAELETKVTSYQEAFVENQRLRRLLDFKTSIGAETVPAQVIMHDLTGWFQTLMVDKGFRDGIAPDMPVVNDEGLIGRILDVSDRHCRVLLITDQGSSVDAIDQRNRVRGILCGKDPNVCLLKYIRSNLDIREGDLVITSGKDGVYPKGLRLGVIQAAYKDPVDLFQKIEVKPLVRLSALEEVLIIKRCGVGLDVEEDGQPCAIAPETQPQTQPNPAGQAGIEANPGTKPAKLPGTAVSKPKTAAKPQAAPRTRTPDSRLNAQTAPSAKPRAKPSGKPPAGSASKPPEGAAGKPPAGSSGKPPAGSAGKPPEGAAGKPPEGAASKPPAGARAKPGAKVKPQSETPGKPQSGPQGQEGPKPKVEQ
jgi:rod shape-determining protein MreC